MAAGRGFARTPGITELVDPRGSEERAHVVWREAVQLFKQEASPLLRNDRVRFAVAARSVRHREVAAAVAGVGVLEDGFSLPGPP